MEFPVVFISGLEDGLIPYFKATETTEELDEERRLFYLGMTRAKDILFMTGARKRRLYAKFQDQEPSRFLKDIPKDCCLWIEKNAIPANAATRTPPPPPPVEFPYNTGCRVKHPKWGIGVIRDCYGEQNDIKVTVNFPNVGVKRLALKYANLEKI
jgi:DNA helicase-2/ATP-dependent DNA helicase PcrA